MNTTKFKLTILCCLSHQAHLGLWSDWLSLQVCIRIWQHQSDLDGHVWPEQAHLQRVCYASIAQFSGRHTAMINTIWNMVRSNNRMLFNINKNLLQAMNRRCGAHNTIYWVCCLLSQLFLLWFRVDERES